MNLNSSFDIACGRNIEKFWCIYAYSFILFEIAKTIWFNIWILVQCFQILVFNKGKYDKNVQHKTCSLHDSIKLK